MPPARLLRSVLATLSLCLALPAAAQAEKPLKLVVLGDSLSSGFFLPANQAFPAMLQAALRSQGRDVIVADAAVTNDTSWGGLARLDRDVPADTDGVILELGANDMVRMARPELTRNALEQIVARLTARKIPVLLVGFRMPITWGHDAAGFEATYRDVARRHRLNYHPDIYAGLWSHPGYRLMDGVHPSGQGVQLMVSGILPAASRFVGSLHGQRITLARLQGNRAMRSQDLPAQPASTMWSWLR